MEGPGKSRYLRHPEHEGLPQTNAGVARLVILELEVFLRG